MRISLLLLATLLMPLPAQANNDHRHAHGGLWFHGFALETDVGESREGALYRWDFDGWIGSDTHKLALKSEGERVDGNTHHAEYWALYSRNVSEFWDAQLGLRQDTTRYNATYLTVGMEGLAPYFFETEAHLFVSDEGDVSARLHLENEFLFTQRLGLKPYLEVSASAQDVEDASLGAGLTEAELGVQLHYEITRHIIPYLDLRYERAFGETSSLRKADDGHNDEAFIALGIRWVF